MGEFLTSERFEQMAREYNAKYRSASVLEKLKNLDNNFDDTGNGDKHSDKENDETIICNNKVEIENIVNKIFLLQQDIQKYIERNNRFLLTKNLGKELEKRLQEFAGENNFLIKKVENRQNFWLNNKICVQRLIEIEKLFEKNKNIAKVRCLCDIYKMMLDFLESFYDII